MANKVKVWRDLEEEWELFKEKAEEAVEKDDTIKLGFEKLHVVFEKLNW